MVLWNLLEPFHAAFLDASRHRACVQSQRSYGGTEVSVIPDSLRACFPRGPSPRGSGWLDLWRSRAPSPGPRAGVSQWSCHLPKHQSRGSYRTDENLPVTDLSFASSKSTSLSFNVGFNVGTNGNVPLLLELVTWPRAKPIRASGQLATVIGSGTSHGLDRLRVRLGHEGKVKLPPPK